MPSSSSSSSEDETRKKEEEEEEEVVEVKKSPKGGGEKAGEQRGEDASPKGREEKVDLEKPEEVKEEGGGKSEERKRDGEDEERKDGDKRRRSRSRERRRRRRRRSRSSSSSSARGRDRKRSRRERREEERKKREEEEEARKKKEEEERKKREREMLTTRTGGAYIPPAKLRAMQDQITDKASAQFQRLAWEALKKSINGLINKVNTPNIAVIVRELFSENIVRGRGLLCQSVMQAQTASPTFTHVYAALASIINTKFPNVGELLLKRLILNFKRGFRRNDKTRCMASTRFIAHLVNQQVYYEHLNKMAFFATLFHVLCTFFFRSPGCPRGPGPGDPDPAAGDPDRRLRRGGHRLPQGERTEARRGKGTASALTCRPCVSFLTYY